jgi:pimeloyl-ACP methyl ester carboxylesterase
MPILLHVAFIEGIDGSCTERVVHEGQVLGAFIRLDVESQRPVLSRVAHFHLPIKPLHGRMPVIEVPCAFAVHPKDVMLVPRSIAANMANLHRWTVTPRGGHFGISEQPGGMINEISHVLSHPTQRRLIPEGTRDGLGAQAS